MKSYHTNLYVLKLNIDNYKIINLNLGDKMSKIKYGPKLIKNEFNDSRKLYEIEDDELNSIASKYDICDELYETDDGEILSYCITDKDFDNNEAEKYKKYGEELYEKTGKLINIDIIGSPHIKCKITKNIVSNVKMIIKLAIPPYSDTYSILQHLKDLVKNKKKLNEEDLFALSMVPMMGPEYDRRNLRIECLELWKEINKKRLIK